MDDMSAAAGVAVGVEAGEIHVGVEAGVVDHLLVEELAPHFLAA